MAGFEKIIPARNGIFEKHMSQWDNPDRSRDDPHTKGLDNVSILYGFLVAARWPSSVGGGL